MSGRMGKRRITPDTASSSNKRAPHGARFLLRLEKNAARREVRRLPAQCGVKPDRGGIAGVHQKLSPRRTALARPCQRCGNELASDTTRAMVRIDHDILDPRRIRAFRRRDHELSADHSNEAGSACNQHDRALRLIQEKLERLALAQRVGSEILFESEQFAEQRDETRQIGPARALDSTIEAHDERPRQGDCPPVD